MNINRLLVFSFFLVSITSINGSVMKHGKSSFPHLQNSGYNSVKRETSQTKPVLGGLNAFSRKLTLDLHAVQAINASKKKQKEWNITKHLAGAVKIFNNLGKATLFGLFISFFPHIATAKVTYVAKSLAGEAPLLGLLNLFSAHTTTNKQSHNPKPTTRKPTKSPTKRPTESPTTKAPSSAPSLPTSSPLISSAGGFLVCNFTVNTIDTGGEYLFTSVNFINGIPRILYYEFINGTLYLATCDDRKCDIVNNIEIVDNSGDVGRFPVLEVDESSDTLVMCYQDVTNGNLLLRRCSNGCANSTAVIVDNSSTTGFSIDMKLAGLSTFISYASFNISLNTTQIHLASCTGIPCNSGNTVIQMLKEIVGSPFADRVHTALAINGIKKFIAYYNPLSQSAELIICDVDCSLPSPIILDSTGNVGQFISLVLIDGEIPALVYWDATNGNFKYVLCDDEACTSWSTTVLDSSGGEYPVIELVNKRIIILYRDKANQKFKLIVCPFSGCNPIGNQTIDTGNVGLHTSLKVAQEDDFAASYTGDGNKTVKIVACFPAPTLSPTSSPSFLPSLLPTNTPSQAPIILPTIAGGHKGYTNKDKKKRIRFIVTIVVAVVVGLGLLLLGYYFWRAYKRKMHSREIFDYNTNRQALEM